MVEIKAPQWCCNCTSKLFLIRVVRCVNIVFLFVSALAMLLQNSNGISFAGYSYTHGAVAASFVFTLLLLIIAVMLLIMHILRWTLKLPKLLWVAALISLAVLTFIWFIVDAVHARLDGYAMGGLGASAAFKFFSTIIWLLDAWILFACVDSESY